MTEETAGCLDMSKNCKNEKFYRSTVLKDYTPNSGTFKDFSYGANSITGWRLNQEVGWIATMFHHIFTNYDWLSVLELASSSGPLATHKHNSLKQSIHKLHFWDWYSGRWPRLPSYSYDIGLSHLFTNSPVPLTNILNELPLRSTNDIVYSLLRRKEKSFFKLWELLLLLICFEH